MMEWEKTFKSLSCLGFLLEAKIYNVLLKKTNPRSTSYSLGYPERSKGCIFYYPPRSTKIVQLINVKFFEKWEFQSNG